MLGKDSILKAINDSNLFTTQIITRINTYKSVASYTRPNDTNIYTVKDALSDSTTSPTVLTFANVGSSSGQQVLINEVLCTVSTKQSVLPQFNLWLFNIAPAPLNDNNGFSLSDSDNDNVVAVIPLYQSFDAVNNARLETPNIQRFITLDPANTSLFGLIEVVNGYTPAALEVFKFTLKGYRL